MVLDIQLAPVDFAVLIAYLAAVVAFGLWVGQGAKNLSDYLLGGRNLPWWAILGSIVATETSTVTFLSVPGIAYAEGGNLGFLQLALGYTIGRFIIVFVLLPLYFQGKIFSAYEILQTRFGQTTRKTASLLFLVTRNLGDGLRLYLTALVLREVIGLPLWLCIVVIGIATIIYTCIGGMKSVVWNDCVQFAAYILGGILAAWIVLQKLPNGWSEYISFAQEHQKLQLFDFQYDLTNPHYIWAGLIGGAFLTLGTHGTDQMMVQRYLCARNQRDAGWALILSGFTVALQFLLFLLIGIGLAAFYAGHPEITFAKNDRVFASFIVTQLPANVGIIGMVLAAVFSAAMSTLSSSLNSSASALVNDWFRANQSNNVDEDTKDNPSNMSLLRVTQWLTAIFGVLQIGIAIGVQEVESVVGSALAIAGFSAGLLLGVFLLGILVQQAGQTSALAGLLCGTIVLVIVRFVLPGKVWLGYEWQLLAWPWFPVVGSVTTFTVGTLISLIFPIARIQK
ncbi:MAG: sodium:solute symporter [Planctomycetales bacterium]|nr:sodium:solute symporter [Planctomycetales bacterium]